MEPVGLVRRVKDRHMAIVVPDIIFVVVQWIIADLSANLALAHATRELFPF